MAAPSVVVSAMRKAVGALRVEKLQGTDDLCCRVSFFVTVALGCVCAPSRLDCKTAKQQ